MAIERNLQILPRAAWTEYESCLAETVTKSCNSSAVVDKTEVIKQTRRLRDPCSRCPIFFFLVCKYAREILEMRGWQGTRAATSIPANSSWRTLSGLLESRRICLCAKFL